MSLTIRIIAALFAGLLVGALLPRDPLGDQIVGNVAPLGTVWLNALRMTIIPLVLALLITGVATTAQAAKGGRIAGAALGWFAALLSVGVLFAAIVTQALLWLWPILPQSSAALRLAAPGQAVPAVPGAMEQVMAVVPSNIFAALTAGDMLPIVLFGLVFGFAAARLETGRSAALLAVVDSVGQVMMTIVGWVLLIAPIGVFALALNVGFRSGFDAAGGLAQYIAIVSVVLILQMLFITYPVAIAFGRVPVRRLIRGYLPPQIFAFTTQSSLASLPSMIAAAQGPLGLGKTATGLVLPLAVAIFRMTSPAGNMAVVLVVANIYGIALGWGTILIGAVIAVIGSLAVTGVASSVSFFIVLVPMCLAMGIPVEILPLLLPVEVLPDLWRTVGNVTADLAVATILGHDEPAEAGSGGPRQP